MKKKQGITVAFLVITFLISLMCNQGSFGIGQSYMALYQAGNGPTVDGTIVGAEWSESYTYSISFGFNKTENQIVQATLYLLHNGSALFIGLNITQGDIHTNPKDAFYIYFDENQDGTLEGTKAAPNEEGAKLTRDGNFTDLCYNGTMWLDELSVGLTKGPSYGVANGNGNWEFAFIRSSEFNVDLPTNVLKPSINIGFDIEFYDANLTRTDSFVTTSNQTSLQWNASKWDILIAYKIPLNEPNLLDIWGFIILVMIAPAILVVYLLIWIIRRKRD